MSTDLLANFTAVKALLSAADWPVFPEGGVPGLNGEHGERPDRYILLAVERPEVEAVRATRRDSTVSWLCWVTAVTSGASTEAMQAQSAITKVLAGARLSIDGRESTPIHHDGTRPVERREGVAECESSWTYHL